MNDTITLVGTIGTEVRHLMASGGTLPITSFRLASKQRRFDRSTQQWVDEESNWYTITTFRQLALNAAASFTKGHRVVVTGRIKLAKWVKDGQPGASMEVVADSLGHDLLWGTTTYSPNGSASSGSDESWATPGDEGGPEPDTSAPLDPVLAGVGSDVDVPF